MQPFDYGYSFFYKQLDIASHIQTFAPQNRQGQNGFENTDAQVHHQLFHEICVAINNHGNGLRDLTYLPSESGQLQTLLTDAEAVHLEDVSRLIDLMMPVGWAALTLLIVLAVTARVAGIALPTLGYSLMILAVLTMLCTATLLVIGPHEIFKAFHELVFPEGNQWFFYYQDSLMTTLMKAPDIFFGIAVIWAILSALIYVLLSVLLKRFSGRATPAKV